MSLVTKINVRFTKSPKIITKIHEYQQNKKIKKNLPMTNLPIQVLKVDPEHEALTLPDRWVPPSEEISVVFVRPEFEDVSEVEVRVVGTVFVPVFSSFAEKKFEGCQGFVIVGRWTGFKIKRIF